MTDWKMSFAYGKVMDQKETKLNIIALLFLCANADLKRHAFKIVIASTCRSLSEGFFGFGLDTKTCLW